jgi:hypothetical protein
VGPDAGQFGNPFQGTGPVEDDGAVGRIGHPGIQVGEHDRRSFDADQVADVEPGFGQFGAQILRAVRVAGERALVQRREDAGALSVADQLEDLRILQVDPVRDEAVDARGPPGDRGGEQQAARPQDAGGLTERGGPFACLGQVVQRAEQQHRVHGRVGQVEVPCVAGRGADRGHPGGVFLELAHVQRHEVPVLDLIAERRQPQRVAARAAADVRDDRGRWRQAAADDLGRPQELKLAAAVAQPVPLFGPFVICAYRGLFAVHGTRR